MGITTPSLQSDEKAPLVDHLIELRQRLVNSVFAILVAFIFCYIFSEEIYAFLVRPLRDIIGPDAKMIYTGLHQAFFTYLKVAFFAGLFLALPVVFTQMWLFIAPGLYHHEKRAILPFLLVTPVLFMLGGALAYYFVFPLAFKFFLSFSTGSIEALPSLPEYLSLAIKMIFAFGIAFELPVGLLLMIKAGIISTQSLINKRKYNIVFAFVAAAILTPPDPLTQVMLAVPLLALYEFSIIAGRGIDRRRAQREAEAAAEEAAEAAAAAKSQEAEATSKSQGAEDNKRVDNP